MAESVGISQTQYSRIETGQSDMTFSQLEKIAEALEVRMEDLITFEPAQYFKNVQNSQIGYNFYYNTVAGEISKLKERLDRFEQELNEIKQSINVTA